MKAKPERYENNCPAKPWRSGTECDRISPPSLLLELRRALIILKFTRLSRSLTNYGGVEIASTRVIKVIFGARNDIRRNGSFL